ncbi:cytochrome P450 [Streptomyces azureus]|uniref:Putative Pentalenene oxygenase n=1 Tax=Streptomyces azureus TaxID=146537 RepID=A0A0K8PDR6_STRAJ|nr:cytochrome P450 [Streptomyces azureus]GAP46010.1 putative Pentalenene oxygenase [Streptomyces azureus]
MSSSRWSIAPRLRTLAPLRSTTAAFTWTAACQHELRIDPHRIVRGSFPAFGAGRRQCIGEAFAWTEVVITLATILQTWFDFRLTSRAPRQQAVMTVTPDVLTMAYCLREPEN